jgi:hypothetical protein
MENPVTGSVFARTGTGKEQRGFGFEIGLITHAASAGAQGRAVKFFENIVMGYPARQVFHEI